MDVTYEYVKNQLSNGPTVPHSDTNGDYKVCAAHRCIVVCLVAPLAPGIGLLVANLVRLDRWL